MIDENKIKFVMKDIPIRLLYNISLVYHLLNMYS